MGISTLLHQQPQQPPTAASVTIPVTNGRVPIPARGVDYRGKVVLAPMVRSGELPSRLMALHYGADLVWSPETVDHSMIGTTRKVNPRTGMIEWTRLSNNASKRGESAEAESVIFRVDPVREAGRLIFQIGTSDPARAVTAAKMVAHDVAGIDVNAGCPKPFSTSGGMGAALLRTPEKLASILEALVQEVTPAAQVGISVKIRLLETATETEALVRRLVRTGITGLTIHCRTTDMRPRERAIRGQLRMIREVCHEAGVACLMNGDVENRDHAAKLMDDFGVDGAMIATAAEKNPSCFRSAAEIGQPLAPWAETVEKYLAYAIETENKLSNTKFMLSQMIPGKSPVYREMQPWKSYTALVEGFKFAGLVEKAAEADRVLALPHATPAKAMPPANNNTTGDSKKRKRQQGDGDNNGRPASRGRKSTAAEPLLIAEDPFAPSATATVTAPATAEAPPPQVAAAVAM
ncbi:hypothetical protein B0H63DRAFT_386383 [Podospora didyma]|uniref:DUS-like FMN-binding domain-containing protein n=1 Tax=Podospora didyma TaxID=330526 RepID=A0AAE0U6T0_9PEZI|nr:hypothetical protein B0H63DRAFT_386383 [Podospora didyma]